MSILKESQTKRPINTLHGRDVFTQENSLDDEYCDALMKVFEDYPHMLHTLDAKSGHYTGPTKYDAINIHTEGLKKFTAFLIHKMKTAIAEYKASYGIIGDIGTRFGTPELMCFRKDGGQITPHVDSNGADHHRSLAIIWYLNDVSDGGVLNFPSDHLNISVQPQKGKLVIFPCDWTHHHYVSPTISNDRYSLMTFLEFE